MLCVDEGADTALCLSLGEDVVDQGRLTRGLRSKDLDDASLGNSSDSEGEIQRKRPCGDGFYLDSALITKLHQRACAELPLDLGYSCLQRLIACLCILILAGSLLGLVAVVCLGHFVLLLLFSLPTEAPNRPLPAGDSLLREGATTRR